MPKISNEVQGLKFPCHFPIKVIGATTDEFEAKTIALVRKHIPDLYENSLKTRRSNKGNYTALTIEVYATSQALLDSIYRDLSAADWVIMAL